MLKLEIDIPDSPAQKYMFKGGADESLNLKIGRAEVNDIVVTHESVSSCHACLSLQAEGYVLEDLNSTNGVFVNERRVTQVRLVEGLEVYLGDVKLHVLVLQDRTGSKTQGVEKSTLPKRTAQKETGAVERSWMEANQPLNQESKFGEEVKKSVSKGSRASSSALRDWLGVFMSFLSVVLMIGCFFGGLTIRHHQQTGKILWEQLAEELDRGEK